MRRLQQPWKYATQLYGVVCIHGWFTPIYNSSWQQLICSLPAYLNYIIQYLLYVIFNPLFYRKK